MSLAAAITAGRLAAVPTTPRPYPSAAKSYCDGGCVAASTFVLQSVTAWLQSSPAVADL
eukprot:CAMPEP_0197893690 /NCGR_PEP_ID=MMETSP1439-20131203/33043_1 /TAXON_ID=66791 /ORGANISM="Gonyaulax spinifera, Strain CCMP409" /LENGTH=58 /DNA_ID=CAMNT_0043513975 /DNA_START=21 /DNA_END=195 /DNA_ORIENTATION=+